MDTFLRSTGGKERKEGEGRERKGISIFIGLALNRERARRVISRTGAPKRRKEGEGRERKGKEGKRRGFHYT